MNLNLAGKIAIVTGGCRGIGESIATQLATEGASVVIADLDEERAKRTLEHIPGEAQFIKMDVTNEAEVQFAVDRIIAEHGRVDILVNNAGVNSRVKLVDMSLEDMERVFRINMFGTFLVTRAVIPRMTEQKKGKIINIAALMGTSPMPMFAHYSASKAAVIAFTKAVALEYAEHNLNINCVSPGAVLTKLWSQESLQSKRKETLFNFQKDIAATFSLGRAQKLEDIANMVCYLASDLTQNITGQNFFVTS